LDIRRFAARIGVVPSRILEDIDAALRIHLSL
jgi:hypothetical protein